MVSIARRGTVGGRIANFMPAIWKIIRCEPGAANTVADQIIPTARER
jgi:hypothetical protein